jgi:nitrate reductase NapE
MDAARPDVTSRTTVERAGGDAIPDTSKVDERRSFLFLTVVMVPALTVMIVGGYGFLVWMYQLIAGPPTA